MQCQVVALRAMTAAHIRRRYAHALTVAAGQPSKRALIGPDEFGHTL